MNRVDYLRGDMAKWLARLNHKYAAEDFFRKLTEAMSDDHSIHTAQVDNSTVFVTGFHLEEKCSFRLGRCRAVIESRIVSLLRNPVLMSYLRQYPVCYDAAAPAGGILGMESEDGIEIHAVALVDEAEQLVYILQTGWDYCYLMTVLNYGFGGHTFNCGTYDEGRVSLHRDTMIVSVSKTGFIRFGDTALVHRMTEAEEDNLAEKRRQTGKKAKCYVRPLRCRPAMNEVSL